MAKSTSSHFVYPEYTPPWWGYDGNIQTILTNFIPLRKSALSSEKTIQIPITDGDKIICSLSLPNSIDSLKNIFIVVHGLTGSSESKCVERVAETLYLKGHAVVRMNLRGCGAGFGHSKSISHSGRSADILAVSKFLSQDYPNSNHHIIGFSKGGNLVLKAAAEANSLKQHHIISCTAVSPPIDLEACVRFICKHKRWVDQYFVWTLKKNMRKHHLHYPELGPFSLPKNINLYQFDDLYTSKQCGFNNAHDYYNKSSSKPILKKLAIPTLIISSEDDPCLDFDIFSKMPKNSNITFLKTAQGGHIAFHSENDHKKDRWLDKTIYSWLQSNKCL